jgi:hypothetical protein
MVESSRPLGLRRPARSCGPVSIRRRVPGRSRELFSAGSVPVAAGPDDGNCRPAVPSRTGTNGGKRARADGRAPRLGHRGNGICWRRSARSCATISPKAVAAEIQGCAALSLGAISNGKAAQRTTDHRSDGCNSIYGEHALPSRQPQRVHSKATASDESTSEAGQTRTQAS